MQYSQKGRRIFAIFAMTLTGAIIGFLYALTTNGSPIDAACIGAVVLGGIAVFEQYYIRQPWGEWLRRSPLLFFVVVSALVWTVLIALSLYFVPTLLGAPPGWFEQRLAQTGFATDMTFSVVAALLLNTAMRLRSLIGGRVLINFLSGRYRHPVEEERIFLFLDLIGSTTIAEKLGPVRYHGFLRDFIEVIEMPVHDFGGEIYQYVGDEVVTTWPVNDSRSNGRAVACHFSMVEAIERRKAYFEKKYGAVPAFSSGVHCGEVVAGEIGDQRKQIVFVGDVVNTAARIQAQARTHGRGLMLSETLLSRVELPIGVQAKGLGMIALKGKAEPIELFEAVRGD